MTKIPVFISYTRSDNVPIPPSEYGWVSRFHQTLEIRLRELLGRAPEVWLDKSQVDGNTYFWEKIEKELGEGGLLVSVLTPSYVQSDSCLRELRKYLQLSSQVGGIKVNDTSKVFKVFKIPVQRDRLPQELQQLEIEGYNFFHFDDRGKPREFVLDLDLANRAAFIEKLYDLAYDIWKLISLLEGGERKPDLGTVFLAESPSDLAAARVGVRRDLLQRGFTVLPETPIAWDVPGCKEVLRSHLDRSHLSVHLIGGSAGLVPDGEQESITALQVAMAAEQSLKRPFPRLMWIPGFSKAQGKQLELIDRILNERAAQPGLEVLNGPIEEVKTLIQQRLTQSKAPAMVPNDADRARIYLVCHEKDLLSIEPLRDFLYDEGYDVDLPVFDDGTERATVHHELLQLDDAVLVYYGASPVEWLRVKLLDLRKAAGYGRSKPFRAQAIYATAPATDEKQKFRSHAPRLIANYGDFSPAVMSPFLTDLRRVF